MGKSAIRPKVEILHISTASEGRQLELNTVFGKMSHALATIVADDGDESLWFEVYVGNQPVQIPLELVREALALAGEHVHSETWYEQRVPMSLAKAPQAGRLASGSPEMAPNNSSKPTPLRGAA